MTAVTFVIGSSTPPGRLHRALGDAARRADAAGVDARVIDLGALRLAPADGRPLDTLGDDTAATVAALTGADALVLATPVYRASLTGTLKNLLDQTPADGLRDTPVGIVAMGATDHHYLGAERHLRDVLSFFGALAAPTAVYLTSADFADGVPSDDAAARLDALVDGVVTLARNLAGAPPIGPPTLYGGPR